MRGYTGVSLITPMFRIQRKVDDVINYLIKKNKIMDTLVKPEWVISQYKKLYDNTTSEITKQNILKDLSKILMMQNDATKVEITNNIPKTPVEIKFSKE